MITLSERVFSIPASVGLWHDFKNSKIITGREVGCLTLGLIHVQLLEKLVIVTSNYLVYKYLFVPLHALRSNMHFKQYVDNKH